VEVQRFGDRMRRHVGEVAARPAQQFGQPRRRSEQEIVAVAHLCRDRCIADQRGRHAQFDELGLAALGQRGVAARCGDHPDVAARRAHRPRRPDRKFARQPVDPPAQVDDDRVVRFLERPVGSAVEPFGRRDDPQRADPPFVPRDQRSRPQRPDAVPQLYRLPAQSPSASPRPTHPPEPASCAGIGKRASRKRPNARSVAPRHPPRRPSHRHTGDQ
jgi:hypothetical protein